MKERRAKFLYAAIILAALEIVFLAYARYEIATSYDPEGIGLAILGYFSLFIVGGAALACLVIAAFNTTLGSVVRMKLRRVIRKIPATWALGCALVLGALSYEDWFPLEDGGRWILRIALVSMAAAVLMRDVRRVCVEKSA